MSKKYTSRLNEIGDTPEGQFMLGRLQGRQNRRARGEDTGGRIKKTTINANEYWGGTDFTHGENYEDYKSWVPPYDEIDSYGEWDSDAYHRNVEAMEQDGEYQCDMYRRVSNKLNKQNENMNKNTIRITESQLKQMITESVKRVINEGMFVEENAEKVREVYSYSSIALNAAKENANAIPEMQEIIQLLTKVEELMHHYYYSSYDYEQDEY